MSLTVLQGHDETRRSRCGPSRTRRSPQNDLSEGNIFKLVIRRGKRKYPSFLARSVFDSNSRCSVFTRRLITGIITKLCLHCRGGKRAHRETKLSGDPPQLERLPLNCTSSPGHPSPPTHLPTGVEGGHQFVGQGPPHHPSLTG